MVERSTLKDVKIQNADRYREEKGALHACNSLSSLRKAATKADNQVSPTEMG